jgi:hypothetical protein
MNMNIGLIYIKNWRKFSEEIDLRINKREIVDDIELDKTDIKGIIPYIFMIVLIFLHFI